MALNYSPIDFRGVAAEPVLAEILYLNDTVREQLVTFDTEIKYNIIHTEATVDVTMQEYTCDEPTALGSQNLFETLVTPVKVMYFDKFCDDQLRPSRFNTSMAPGAWNTLSTEYERMVIQGLYAAKISQDIESKFWNNVTSSTKSAVAGLTAGTAQTQVSASEKALVAATTTGLFDGVVQKMIYNDSNVDKVGAVGGRIKVTGATGGPTALNVKDEYDKVFAAIPDVLLLGGEQPYIYAPRKHRMLIAMYDNNPTNFKTAFSVSDDKTKYYFNGIEIKFVPIPDNVIIVSKPSHLFWDTDLITDQTYVESDKVSKTSDMRFIKSVLTIAAHVGNQQYNVLYVAPLS